MLLYGNVTEMLKELIIHVAKLAMFQNTCLIEEPKNWHSIIVTPEVSYILA